MVQHGAPSPTAAFFDAPGRPIFAGRFGNAENGSIDGPGLFVLDLGLFKDFKVGRRRSCASRSRPRTSPTTRTTANPAPNLTSPNYGRITSLPPGTLGSRVIVLGARFIF